MGHLVATCTIGTTPHASHLSACTWYAGAGAGAGAPVVVWDARLTRRRSHGGVCLQLVAFITTPLSLALPIPCGLFTPFFAFGAVFGRAFGQMAASVAPHAGVVPGAYAVVGAAAFTSGATQSLSTTVIVFELTGQLHHMVPVLLATVIAYSIAGLWYPRCDHYCCGGLMHRALVVTQERSPFRSTTCCCS